MSRNNDICFFFQMSFSQYQEILRIFVLWNLLNSIVPFYMMWFKKKDMAGLIIGQKNASVEMIIFSQYMYTVFYSLCDVWMCFQPHLVILTFFTTEFLSPKRQLGMLFNGSSKRCVTINP